MGLTIHYTITPRQPIDKAEARRLILAANAATLRLVRRRGYSYVSRPKEADLDEPWLDGTVLRKVDAHTSQGYGVPPLIGGYYTLDLGKDCETAIFGLCKYPATLEFEDGGRLRTGIGGWRFQACCKTQYASLHGWEPFFASHKFVIDAALGGAFKDASDEGGPSVESPIFAHPRFEHLEAEGMATHAAAIRKTASAFTGA